MTRDKRQEATALLVNYFEAVARKAGMKWDPDYAAEIGQAVDTIIEAAVEDVIDQLRDHVKAEALR